MFTLVKIFYVSHCVATTTLTDIRSVVGGSQLRNRRAGVTGLLAYTGAHFAQALEGPRHVVQPLLDIISADSRHANMRVLLSDTDSNRRDFEGWSMHLLDSPDLAESVQALLDTPEVDTALARQVLGRVRDMVHWNNASDLMPPPFP